MSRLRKHRGAGYRRFRDRSPVALLPNIVTILAMCCGLTAVRLSLMHSYEAAVIAVLLAAFFDVADGRIARFFKTTSPMGAELDSLADLLNFGAVPGLVLYIRYLHVWDASGWCIILFYVVCVALRLARFNVLQKGPNVTNDYFVGVPSTIGGFLVLWPMMIEFTFGIKVPTIFIACHTLLIGGLMVSRLRTFAIKNLHVKPGQVVPVLLGVVFVAGCFYVALWGALTVIGAIYLSSLVFSNRYLKVIPTP